MTNKSVNIYTDGACSGNPGPGGWGVVLYYGDLKKELSGSDLETTNNRMELLAVINALKSITKPILIELYTDSRYVIDGTTKWINNWKKNGWKNSEKKPVKNSDLWKELDNCVQKHDISWNWVKGHSGNPGNEAADALARNAIISALIKEESA